MFQNCISTWRCLLNCLVIHRQIINPRLVIITCCTLVRHFLRKAFRQVKTVAINAVFLQPIFQTAVHIRFCQDAFMVHIRKNAVRMRRSWVQIRMITEGVHSRQCAIVNMIKNNIANHGNPVLVAYVHKLLEFVGCAVIFVQRIMKSWIPVRCHIEKIEGFSAHADWKAVLRWLSGLKVAPKKVFTTHGEPEAAEAMAGHIRDEYGWTEEVPTYGETFELK